MTVFHFIILSLLFTGCASRGEKLRDKFPDLLPQKKINVSFISQEKFHCAPASVWMVSNFLKQEIPLTRLNEMLYTPEQKGTFQNDVIAAIRRLGLIALPVNKMKTLLQELNNDHPVLVFQNLGLSWAPKWHYALAVGYDLKDSVMLLHSGSEKNYPMKISTFERIWKRVDNWGLLIVKPGLIPESATEIDMVKATAGLELAKQNEAARISYEQIIKKWPDSFGAQLGLGSYFYEKDDYKKSTFHFKKATELNPEAAGAWNNYALALKEYKKIPEARVAAKKAMEKASPALAEIYKKNLADLLVD